MGGFQNANIDLPTVVTPYTTTANTVGGLVYAATGSYHTMYRFAIIPVIIGLLVFTVYYFTKLRKKQSPEELIEQGETNV